MRSCGSLPFCVSSACIKFLIRRSHSENPDLGCTCEDALSKVLSWSRRSSTSSANPRYGYISRAVNLSTTVLVPLLCLPQQRRFLLIHMLFSVLIVEIAHKWGGDCQCPKGRNWYCIACWWSGRSRGVGRELGRVLSLYWGLYACAFGWVHSRVSKIVLILALYGSLNAVIGSQLIRIPYTTYGRDGARSPERDRKVKTAQLPHVGNVQ